MVGANLRSVIFGHHVRPADTVVSAEWIADACRGVWWTVGALVPNQYPQFLRVRAPDPNVEDWWSAYRGLYEIIASIGERHTASPDRAWFAVWEGHGFASSITQVAWRGPLDDETRRALDEKRLRLRNESERRNTAIRAALRDVPRFDLPNRTYYLLRGPVMAATQLRYPAPSNWLAQPRPVLARRPAVVRRHRRGLLVALHRRRRRLHRRTLDNVPRPAELVELDRQLEIED